MAIVEIKGLRIGEGAPAICVPLTGSSEEEYITQAVNATAAGCDLIELRIDYYRDVFNIEKVQGLLEQIQQNTDLPVLFTFRSAKEGGERESEKKEYISLYKNVISSGYVDLIDLELFQGEDVLTPLITQAKEKNVKVIISSHDFQKTPPKEEMVARLCKMQQLGADIAKLAVMPVSKQDVLTLMETTAYMQENHGRTPVVGISMGKLGLISRLSGSWSGSTITFGTVGKASAPGQISVAKIRQFYKLCEEL